MHELSIALSILDIVDEQTALHGGCRVSAIRLKLGPLAGVVKEALVSAFELAIEQTPHHGSRLVIEEIPIAMDCPTCCAVRAVQSVQWLCCVECGTPALEVLQGRELELSGLELADA